jgi:ABC1 atypical kinase-like domain
VDAYLKMLLKDNFVHTDLHPGNIFVRARCTGRTLQKAPPPQPSLTAFQRGPSLCCGVFGNAEQRWTDRPNIQTLWDRSALWLCTLVGAWLGKQPHALDIDSLVVGAGHPGLRLPVPAGPPGPRLLRCPPWPRQLLGDRCRSCCWTLGWQRS